MYTIEDWLRVHRFDLAGLSHLVAKLGQDEGLLPATLPILTDYGTATRRQFVLDRDTAFHDLVTPALLSFLDGDDVALAMAEIEVLPSAPGVPCPYALDRGVSRAPLVVMPWNNQPSDLLHLGHEAAHALQIRLLRSRPVPPVTREVCAFLGELVLLDWIRTRDLELWSELSAVWISEASWCLVENGAALAMALQSPRSAYDYRLNYPLARVAAAATFASGSREEASEIFRIGTSALFRLPSDVFDAAASRSDRQLCQWATSEPEKTHVRKVSAFSPVRSLISRASEEGGRLCATGTVQRRLNRSASGSNSIQIAPEWAWSTIVRAACVGFPEQRTQIERAARQTVVDLSTDGSSWLPWMILIRSPGKIPVLQGGFDGSGRDLVRLAFQFGQALQLVCTPLRKVALLEQEIAGCVCVNLLLDLLHNLDKPLYHQAYSAWLEVVGVGGRSTVTAQDYGHDGLRCLRELPLVDPAAAEAASAVHRVASRLSLWYVVTGEAAATDLLRSASILEIGTALPFKVTEVPWANSVGLQDLGLRGGALRGSFGPCPGELLATWDESPLSSASAGPHLRALPPAPISNLAMEIGLAIHLLAGSPYHRQFPVARYLPVEILPPFRLGQAQIYLDARRRPVGLVTWARVSRDILCDVLATGRALQEDEWNSGSQVFINDWITEESAFRAVVTDVETRLFPYEVATSLRRTPEGGVRRVNRWRGIGLRRSLVERDRKRSGVTTSAEVPRMTCPVTAEGPKQAHAVSLFTGGAPSPKPNR